MTSKLSISFFFHLTFRMTVDIRSRLDLGVHSLVQLERRVHQCTRAPPIPPLCVCVCVRGREFERGRESVCACVRERETERERGRERKREKGRESV